MRTWRKMVVVGALFAAMTSVAACGSGDDKADAPEASAWQDEIKGGEIEVGVLPAKGTPSLAFLEDIADSMGKDVDGAEVKLTFANTEARPAIEQRWRSGDPLDVDYGMFDGTNPALLDWARDGKLLDLTPYLEQEDKETGKPWIDSFSPAAMQFMQDPETQEIYGIPSELSLQVLFYNAKIFKENGITPPKTWDDLTAASAQLKSAGVDPIAVTGLFEPYMGMWTDNLWMRTVGYDKVHDVLIEGEGSVKDDPGFLDGLQKVQDLRDNGDFLEGFEGTDFTAAQAQFFQGKAGMILMGSWLVSEMKDVIPADFELGVLAFPTVEGGAGDENGMMAMAQLMSVAADSDNIPLALEWTRRMTTVETQTARAEEIGEVSAVTGVPSPPGLPGISDVVGSVDQLYPAYYGILQSKAKDIVYPEVAKLFFGKQDAEETLDAIDAGLKRVYGN
ncbi:extracellular solute-binding protein [Mumia sp. DW29H23]|uniref:ABC transporter substrate-binding protein n=1 Tax=Mumia sp. DW29H23 TaxID=3421241 RepID=UPI003D6834E6